MDIFPNSYGRTDGKVTAFKNNAGWVLQSIHGPAWFWNHQTKAWNISGVPGFRTDAPAYVMSEADALALLRTIEPVGSVGI